MHRLAFLLILLHPTFSRGHDYWLEPTTYVPAVNKLVAISLHVGDHYKSEGARAFEKKHTLSFRLIGVKATTDLAALAREGARPQISLKCPAAGTYLVAMERDSRLITLEAKKFNAYLTEEGLTAILAERKKAAEDGKPGRERYWRSLKCLLQAGGASDETWKKVLGHKLEIIPLGDPAALQPGDTLRVRVLLYGKPVAGAQVQALSAPKGKVVALSAQTSAKGEASFKLDHAGPCLVRLVHMRRAAKDRDADWESFWAALTFAVRAKK